MGDVNVLFTDSRDYGTWTWEEPLGTVSFDRPNGTKDITDYGKHGVKDTSACLYGSGTLCVFSDDRIRL